MNRCAPVITASMGYKTRGVKKSLILLLPEQLSVTGATKSTMGHNRYFKREERKQRSVNVLIGVGSILKKQPGHRREAQQRRAEQTGLA